MRGHYDASLVRRNGRVKRQPTAFSHQLLDLLAMTGDRGMIIFESRQQSPHSIQDAKVESCEPTAEGCFYPRTETPENDSTARPRTGCP